MVIVFALAAAVLYGSADFLGGAASRHSRALSVAVLSVPVGALVMLAAALAAGGQAPTAGLGWAVASGGFGAVGLMVFYAGLAAGPMSVVAPVSALVSTVLASLERGTPSRPAANAPGSGFLAGHPALRGLVYGTVCGAMFGIFFVFLRNAGSSGVFWPVCTARLANSAVVIAVAVLAGARPVGREAGPRVLAAAVGSGVLDASANLCYVLATRAGLFGIAAVLTSLYPGITVLLARIVLRERMQAVQRLGLLLAAAGVVLVTL